MSPLEAITPRPLVRHLAVAAIVGIISLGTFDAKADGESLDTVFLKGGGRLRGTVAQEDPKAGVIIKLADGSTRTVASPDVLSVAYAEHSVAPTQPIPPRPEGPLVKLETADPNVSLDRVGSSGEFVASRGLATATVSGSEWTTVCRVPCEKRLDPNASYLIHGNGMPSKVFGLGTKEDMTLHVRVRSAGPTVAGVMLLGIGIGAAVTGGLLAGMGSHLTQDPSSTRDGLALAGGGVAFMIPGIVLLALPGTTVTTDDGRRLASASPLPRWIQPTPNGFVF